MSSTPLTISYQPAMYWALPIYLADRLKYFEELGLDPSFVAYPSGGPQVAAAAESKAWDIGGAGVVPNILGWTKSIETIGISNDESATNALVANANGVVDWPTIVASGTLGDGVQMIITPNSTGQFAAEACLDHYGVEYDPDSNFLYSPDQAAVIAGMSGLNVANFGSLWAPNTYAFVEKNAGAEVICNGTTAGAPVPGGIMVRKEFGEEHPDIVAKVLAAWLRGINYMLDPNYRDDTIAHLRKFYAFPVSDRAIEIEFTRPLYDIEGQLEMMKRIGTNGEGPSTLGSWFKASIDFMLRQGTLAEEPDPDSFINNSYMRMVFEDEYLREFTKMPGPKEVNYNYLTAIRPVGLAFAGLIIVGSIACVLWTWRRRKGKVVRASQPFFLVMICVGTLIMGSSIIPLSIDDSIATETGCTKACIAFPWLLSIGFSTIFSALMSKIWRINRIQKNAQNFRRISVRARDVLTPFVVLMTLNVLLLLLWTLLDPLVWMRTEPNSDYQSYGYCTTQGNSWKIFIALLVALNFCALTMACFQAWRARKISTEFSESSYVAYTIFSLLQALLIGLPVLLLVQDNAMASYFVWSVLIFIVCATILILLFIPKMKAVRKKEKRRASTVSAGMGGSRFSEYSSYERRNSDHTHASASTIAQAASLERQNRRFSSLEKENKKFKDGLDKLKDFLQTEGIADADVLFEKAGLLALTPSDAAQEGVGKYSVNGCIKQKSKSRVSFIENFYSEDNASDELDCCGTGPVASEEQV